MCGCVGVLVCWCVDGVLVEQYLELYWGRLCWTLFFNFYFDNSLVFVLDTPPCWCSRLDAFNWSIRM